ncbi:hypothetical protein HCU40_13650 [Pseudanabaena biceps]|nr:hypothetical protein [Pseudanabaena biceps]
MKSLGLRTKNYFSLTIALYLSSSAVISGFVLTDKPLFDTSAIAQSINPIPSCPQLSNRPYAVVVDRPANSLPQLPEFLAIAAVPCSYLNTSMTFFGGFDNIQASSFRANQLRQLQIDAVIHSFSQKVNDIPVSLRGALVLVELTNDPNLEITLVQSLSGKNAVFASFNNRSVILAAPLSSQTMASAIATKLRSQGLAAQVVGASLIANPNISANPVNSSVPRTSLPSSTPKTSSNSVSKIYRVLVPNNSASRLRQIREFAPDAFEVILRGKSYIQARTYTDRGNAHRERDRLNVQFPGTVLIQD